MLDPIINFFAMIFNWIGRCIGWVIAVFLWPFITFGAWYKKRGWIIKGCVGLFLLCLFLGYGWFVVQSQRWTNFDPAYANAYQFVPRVTASGDGQEDEKNTGHAETSSGNASSGNVEVGQTTGNGCQPSAIVTVSADLIDFNVNQNRWMSSMLLYKMGLFGLDWDKTPFLDDKASFQRGIHQAVRRIGVELVDRLGRVRGTSQVDQDLQDARGNLQFDESTWYFGLSPFGPKTPSPSFYRAARKSLLKFNERLKSCDGVFDARADNLIQLMDRISSDIGSTSDILVKRSENYDSGWFDTRADDRFWFAYGQLYAYGGLLQAMQTDFADVIRLRGLAPLWQRMQDQVSAALAIRPFIISNGAEDGWIMPTHLATMGFYVLRIRSNLVEARDILDR